MKIVQIVINSIAKKNFISYPTIAKLFGKLNLSQFAQFST